MLNMNLSSLVASLDIYCRQALEDSAAACVSRGGHEIGIEDYVEKLIEQESMRKLLVQFSLSADALLDKLKRPQGKVVSQARPVFSTLLIELLQEAYLLNSLELKREQLDVFVLVLTMLKNPARYSMMSFFQELGKIPAEELTRIMQGLDEESGRAPAGAQLAFGNARGGMLELYATDFTEEARQGRIDPVFARGSEIRQMVDILSRRRKNNPILVGDPGVGKTAAVEGLALKIVEGNIPTALHGTRLVGLDMGRLQAGASVKGEFEKRLKGVIDEIKASPVPTILFIDEAHTLVGSGNEAGSGDGANLLKPALARGELRTIAATTWSEYKKYFEKDAALARRFQLVKLDQPGLADTMTILRGIVPHYEKTHNIYIRDDAVAATAEMSTRYLTGRQQPDKAIDVLDTACARVKVSLGAKPPHLETLEEEIASCRRELDALERDCCHGVHDAAADISATRHAQLQGKVLSLSEEIAVMRERWEAEKKLVAAIIAKRTGTPPTETSAPKQDVEPANEEEAAAAPASEQESLASLTAKLQAMQGDDPLVFYEVTPQLVASIIAEWTGIPLGKLTEDGADKLANLEDRLRLRVKGQDHALQALGKAALASRAGMNNPNAPTAIFLLVGPSGVGKTETALAVSDEMYGGEDKVITINMSEFQEKHTISRLIGSPPGYVGYGEGGRLTEAVRRQPYSVVLFDEVEKAHPDVINLFYQMFDKGVLSDGEGRDVNFRNTMIFLTSNLGSDIIAALCDDDEAPAPEILHEALRPALTQFFKPALLGRMTIIPYTQINPAIMKELVTLKLTRVGERLTARHTMELTWSEQVADSIAAGCNAVDTGARNIDHIVNAWILPGISTAILGQLNDRKTAGSVLHIDLSPETNTFTFAIRTGQSA